MPPSSERARARPLAARVEGTPIRGELYGKGKQTVVLLHGLLSDSRELGPLPMALAAEGLSALSVDLRGHGRSGGRASHVTRERVLGDLLAWKYQLSEEGLRLAAICGHSLGGTWAVAAANVLEPDCIGALCSPASIASEVGAAELFGYKAGRRIHKVAAKLGKDDLWVPYKIKPKDALDSPEAIERMREEGILRTRVPLHLVDPLLAVDGATWAEQATCPALFAVASNDRVVDHTNTRRLYEAYAGEKTWMELPGPHSCFYDASGPECAAKVAGWFAERLLDQRGSGSPQR